MFLVFQNTSAPQNRILTKKKNKNTVVTVIAIPLDEAGDSVKHTSLYHGQ